MALRFRALYLCDLWVWLGISPMDCSGTQGWTELRCSVKLADCSNGLWLWELAPDCGVQNIWDPDHWPLHIPKVWHQGLAPTWVEYWTSVIQMTCQDTPLDCGTRPLCLPGRSSEPLDHMDSQDTPLQYSTQNLESLGSVGFAEVHPWTMVLWPCVVMCGAWNLQDPSARLIAPW